MKTSEISKYILSFLLDEEDPSFAFDSVVSGNNIRETIALRERRGSPVNYSRLIGYTSDLQEMRNYRLVIYPSGFFDFDNYGHPHSMPTLPLEEWNGIPLLFGSSREETIEGNGYPTKIIYADIVASTFFLISRYEEMFKRSLRDSWGRFPGRESLPFVAGFLHRPIVDEYGAALRRVLMDLGIPVPEHRSGFRLVNLTHDIDQPYEYRGIRSFFRALLKEKLSLTESYRRAFSPMTKDRFFSFARFLDWNDEVRERTQCRVRTLFFYKTPGEHPQDRPNYTMKTAVMRRIRELALRYGVESGLHVNLSCSMDPSLIEQELHLLQESLGGSHITISRHHFLACREPEDFLVLRASGILHDYTMGYADIAGFRLGTCRPVRFILPSTGVITDLLLHPLYFMDYTLEDKKYMGLNYEQALSLTSDIISKVYQYGGELNLLFHNEKLSSRVDGYQVRLYRKLLRRIITLDNQSLEQESSTQVLEDLLLGN